MDEWNRENPRLALTPAKKQGKLDGEEAGTEDDTELAKDGDEILQQLSRYRGLMIPQQGWPLTLRQFEEKWTRYKQNLGLLDFTDLIERCLPDVAIAPRDPAVIFADEAQDLNRMQLTLIRKWGERANYFILAGDDDQTIFSFTGASPGRHPRPGHSGGPQDHPEAVVSRAARRARRRGQADPAGHETPGEDLPGATGGWRGPPALDAAPTSRPSTSSSRAPRSICEQGKTVMFLRVLLVHAAAAGRGAAEERHPVPQPVPEDQRLLESAADRQEGFERQPHPGAAGGAPRLR